MDKENLKEKLIAIGLWKLVAFFTLVTIAISVGLAYMIFVYTGSEFSTKSLIASIVIPAIITPLFSSINIKLCMNLYEMEKKMRELATKDYLTGVYTRRAFSQHAETLFNLSSRNYFPVAVFYLDIDHFKSINDRFGHQCGDEVLVQFCNIIRQSTRKSDIAGRIGGEEFAVITANMNRENALNYAVKLRKNIEAAQFTYKDTTLAVTASIGVSVLENTADKQLEDLYSEADQALYYAKNNGRNKVCVHDTVLTTID